MQQVQLCLDGFYNGTSFHRLVKDFIAQGGENSEPADLIEPIKNEFHSRLRFCRRGLVGMATNEGTDNNMQFFFTLDQTPELQNTHTIFGKVTGDTIYNMIKLNDSQTDHHDKVLYPHKINKVKILNNPFPDIVPRFDKSSSIKNEDDSKKKSKKAGVKNFSLMSFGDEAEQDEMEVVKTQKKTEQASTSSWKKDSKKEKDRKKSKTPPPKSPPQKSKETKNDEENDEYESDEDYAESMKKEKMAELERKRKEIQDQIKDLKKQYHSDRKEKNKEEKDDSKSSKKPENEAIQSYLEEKEKYKSCKIKSKGASREEETLKLLARFKQKLQSAATSDKKPSSNDGEISNDDDENWLGHKLDFSESQEAVLAKDASKKQDDWYDIYDPRNPLNKRKRGESSKHGSSKKMK